jgi:hypothetical protein
MLRDYAARRAATSLVIVAFTAAAGCGSSGYAVRAVPRIAAEQVGQPVSRLQEALGAPRKIDASPNKMVYVWFLAQAPDGAPPGFHGCELEATVDPGSQRVLGVSLSDIGWTRCGEVQLKIRIARR